MKTYLQYIEMLTLVEQKDLEAQILDLLKTEKNVLQPYIGFLQHVHYCMDDKSSLAELLQTTRDAIATIKKEFNPILQQITRYESLISMRQEVLDFKADCYQNMNAATISYYTTQMEAIIKKGNKLLGEQQKKRNEIEAICKFRKRNPGVREFYHVINQEIENLLTRTEENIEVVSLTELENMYKRLTESITSLAEMYNKILCCRDTFVMDRLIPLEDYIHNEMSFEEIDLYAQKVQELYQEVNRVHEKVKFYGLCIAVGEIIGIVSICFCIKYFISIPEIVQPVTIMEGIFFGILSAGLLYYSINSTKKLAALIQCQRTIEIWRYLRI